MRQPATNASVTETAHGTSGGPERACTRSQSVATRATMSVRAYTSNLCHTIIARVKERPEIWQFSHPLYSKRIVHKQFWEEQAADLGVNGVYEQKWLQRFARCVARPWRPSARSRSLARVAATTGAGDKLAGLDIVLLCVRETTISLAIEC